MKAEEMPCGLQGLVRLVDPLAERWKGLFLPLLALSILGLPGCMEDERLASGALGAEAIDSGGIVIVSNQAGSDERPLLVVADEPVVSIGDQHPLDQVQGAIRTADGRIMVADRGSGALLFFDEDGSLVSTAGGPGEGPGEFRSLGKPIPYRGDSILVHDGAVGRITVFDGKGRVGRTSTAPDLAFMDPVGAFPDGSIVARRWVVYRSSETETGVDRQQIVLLRLEAGGDVADTIGSFAGHETFFYSGERVATMWPIPFGRTLEYDVGGDRLAVGATDSYSIAVYGLGGVWSAPDWIVRLDRDPVEVREEWLDSMKASEEARLQPGSALTSSSLEEIWESLPLHRTLPSFNSLRLDAEGRLWVERYRSPDEKRATWDVFDSEGYRLGSVTIPQNVFLTDLGEDWILGIRRDEWGIERVELYSAKPSS